jgi:hypothetical protein
MDRVIRSMDTTAKRGSRQFPAQKLIVLQGAGHFPMVERPKADSRDRNGLSVAESRPMVGDVTPTFFTTPAAWLDGWSRTKRRRRPRSL